MGLRQANRLSAHRGRYLDLRRPIKVFDFFSGCGGTSAGLRAAGMEITLGVDNDVDAGLTFQANFPETAFLSADIRRLSASALDSLVADIDGSPLLFSACAPCQPFSKQRGVPPEPGDKVESGLQIDDFKVSRSGTTITRGRTRISVFSKNTVAEAELPLQIMNDFATMSKGLLPNVAVAALAALRENTYQLLGRKLNQF